MDHAMMNVLHRSRALGFLGPGPVESHVEHAGVLIEALTQISDGARQGAGDAARVIDLGSGGGVPGLVLARALPGTHWVLLDAGERRTTFLTEAVAELGLAERVVVLRSRAEVAGRDPNLRGQFHAVVARSFGAPAVTAECAAPFLMVGGRLMVSEPPSPDPRRWPEDSLCDLGLTVVSIDSWATFAQTLPCPERYPRREGQPSKRPLW